MLGTVPLYSFLSAVFLKKLPWSSSNIWLLHIRASLVCVLINFTFNIHRLSIHFSLTFTKLSENLSWFSAFIFNCISIFYSFHVAFLRIFLWYILFAICATIILVSFSSFCIFWILLFPLVLLFFCNLSSLLPYAFNCSYPLHTLHL